MDCRADADDLGGAMSARTVAYDARWAANTGLAEQQWRSPITGALDEAFGARQHRLLGPGTGGAGEAAVQVVAQAGSSAKRRCPFGEATPLQLKTYLPDTSGYAAAEARLQRDLMMTAQRQLYGGNPGAPAPGAQGPTAGVAIFDETSGAVPDEVCHICCEMGSAVKCGFCTKMSCASCAHQCDECHDTFCSFCSTPNYDLRCDRRYCLDCNADIHAAGQS